MKSGNFKFLRPTAPHQGCNGTVLSLPLSWPWWTPLLATCASLILTWLFHCYGKFQLVTWIAFYSARNLYDFRRKYKGLVRFNSVFPYWDVWEFLLLNFFLFLFCFGVLTFWRRNYFFLILAHPVYNMWIIQEPNTLELWNKLHFEEKKQSIYHI